MRYLYDISGTYASTDQPQSFYGTSFYAHGNLFQTQTYVGPTSGSPMWRPVSANAYDPLDRSVSAMKTAVCANKAGVTGPIFCIPSIEQTVSTYDANGYLGMLTATQHPNGAIMSDYYDNQNRESSASQTASGTTSLYEALTYDQDGRTLSTQKEVAPVFRTRNRLSLCDEFAECA